MATVHIRVPATSANLGSGFDCAGLAIEYFDDVIFQCDPTKSESLELEIHGEGEQTLPRDSSHLVAATFLKACKEYGYHAGAVRIVCHNHIPQARGMGSSAEAIVAAVSAAYALSHDSIQRDEIFALAASYEGHPDNVAPAVYGGFTISWFENVFHTVNYEVSRELQASIFIPDFELSTEQARRALPKTVAYSDALYNLSRSALLPAALRPEIAASSAKKSELLFVATQDALHQPYRKSLMPLSWALVEGLRKQGIAAAISGAGPCVIALYFGDMPIMDMARQAGMGEHWRALHVPINNTGVQIEVQ